MPSQEKQVATHVFTDGIDTVTARELKRPTTAEYMLNCYILSQGAGSVGIVTNSKGNKMVSFPLPAGTNKCLGTATDEENNKLIYFISNSNGYHGIYKYDGLTRSISRLFENLTDSANIDVMKLDPAYLILHANIIDGDKLYWVDGLNNARKTNLTRLVDKTPAGYGPVIQQSFIDLYKKTARYAPTGVYFSEPSRVSNYFYGSLMKLAQLFIYRDGERSTYSDISSVILPDNEPFSGINAIPSNNNGVKATVDTGDHDVKIIEVVAQFTSGENNNEGFKNWVLINTINKADLGLSDNSTYTFEFFNETDYPAIDQADFIRPYDYILREPRCQAVAKSRLTLTNGKEGRPTVKIDASVTVRYEDLFIDPGVENKFNEPLFTHAFGTPPNDRDILDVYNQDAITADGVLHKIFNVTRFNVHTLTIGNDVKKGNKFYLNHTSGSPSDTFNFIKEASVTDSALTIANYFKQQLLATGRIYKKTRDLTEFNIYNNVIDGDGNVSFSYIMRSATHEPFMSGSANPTPVQYDTLKDTGQSVRNEKMGSTHRFAIQYKDADGRKEGGYTSPAMVRRIKPINDDGIKASITVIELRNLPPKWATHYQILRTKDLTRDDFIELLIQNVVEVSGTDDTEYLDLVIGGFFTYKKIHPNSTLNFPFEKGDRLSLIKKTSDDSYYPFFETEIINYSDVITDHVKSNLVTNGSSTVTVAEASDKDIGKFLVIDGNEREIVAAPSGTTYQLNSDIGDATAKTYLSYDMIDRRGVLRIRKPSTDVIAEIEDLSMVEIYKPSRTAVSDQKLFEFQQQYAIINPGTDTAYHAANKQDQTATLPAIIEISGGESYVRNRECPTNNVVPGTQVLIEVIEDPSYSDFYESRVNDNGRTMAEDKGFGEVFFGSRTRYSKNFIEDTSINGLSSFPNLNRKDFNDDSGDIHLTKFDNNRLFLFKELVTAYSTIDSVLTQDNIGNGLLVNSNDYLNPIQYLTLDGGIGDNPESYAKNNNHQYYVSANAGLIVRIGGNGQEPISKTYSIDNEAKELLNKAINNKARIFGGFDRVNGTYIVSIEGFEEYIYFDGFTGWVVSQPVNAVFYEVVTGPAHGTLNFTNPTQWTYTPDADYIGPDTWSYRAALGGGQYTQPNNVCLTVIDNPNLTTAWRVKSSSAFCVLDQYGLQTGYLGWTTLEEFYVVSNEVTGNEKPNVDTDVDYAAPIFDNVTCVPVEPDPTPDPYSFTAVIDAELSTMYESDVVTPVGYNIPIDITIPAGSEYRLNGGSWTSDDGTMNPGDTLQVRTLSSGLYETEVLATPTAGGVSADFSITTKEEPLSFHSLVTAGTPQRNLSGNDGGVYPSTAPYQWDGSLANNDVIINGIPGTSLNGWLSSTNHVLTSTVAQTCKVRVVANGTLTFFNDVGQNFYGFADFLMKVAGTTYQMSAQNPPTTGFTFPYQYYTGPPSGSGSHREVTIPYSFSFEQDVVLAIGDQIALYMSPRYSAVLGTVGTVRINNISMDIKIDVIP